MMIYGHNKVDLIFFYISCAWSLIRLSADRKYVKAIDTKKSLGNDISID